MFIINSSTFCQYDEVQNLRTTEVLLTYLLTYLLTQLLTYLLLHVAESFLRN